VWDGAAKRVGVLCVSCPVRCGRRGEGRGGGDSMRNKRRKRKGRRLSCACASIGRMHYYSIVGTTLCFLARTY
jgi:hypothetical protein